MKRTFWLILLLALLIPTATALAQDDNNTEPAVRPQLPTAYMLNGFTYHAQMWNNCGPATLTMALSYFGYRDNQVRAADWLKPNTEDKNVSPWQIVEYVNNEVPELPIYAMKRYGGTIDMLKTLVFNGFPVMIEAGYDPERANQGWMGHYLLVIGYDDAEQVVYTLDSYDGQDGNPLPYSYAHINEHWQHFNYVYIPFYESGMEPLLRELLGTDADEQQNYINAFNRAQTEAIADNSDPFAWFNMGSMLVELEMYEDAEIAYDQARDLGLPWRMLWYQFGPYEAYYAVGRYDDMLELANTIVENSSGYVEEAYFYAGLARAALGETDRAIANFNTALNFNPNFVPAREQIEALRSG
ncbi:MAG: C39 family peptidase [Chloroflexota bacterium]